MSRSIKSYNNHIYPLSAVKYAIIAYAEIAKIQVKTVADENICTFTEKEIPIQLVIREFGNYLIEILNNNHGVL